jgi:hypothetical protein
MTTPMNLPEMISYDIAVIAKLMLAYETQCLTNQDIVLMEKLSYENILTNITLHQIDNFATFVISKKLYFIECDKLSRFSLYVCQIFTLI